MDNVGMLSIYSLTNTANPGEMPTEKLVYIEDAYYEKRNVGVTRIYAALGADRRFDMVVRCFNTFTPQSGMYVIIENEQYQIDVCQEIIGQDAIDLTLVRVEEYYEVAQPTTQTDSGLAYSY